MPPAMAWRERSYSSADLANRLRKASSMGEAEPSVTRRVVFVRESEDLRAVVRNGDGVLEVAAQAAVHGHGRPPIFEHAHGRRTEVDLRLNGDAHPGAQQRSAARRSVVLPLG